jgi:hypothetical protein
MLQVSWQKRTSATGTATRTGSSPLMGMALVNARSNYCGAHAHRVHVRSELDILRLPGVPFPPSSICRRRLGCREGLDCLEGLANQMEGLAGPAGRVPGRLLELLDELLSVVPMRTTAS